MKKNGKLIFYNIISYVHVTFWLSLISFLTIYLTLGILLIPALCSVFLIGKDIIYGEYDTTDSVLKRFFRGLKENIGMMKFFPLQLIFLLEGAGIYAANASGLRPIVFVCTALMSLILTYIIFLCLYRVHFNSKCDSVTVCVVMLYSLPYMLTIWLVMTLVCLFTGTVTVIASLLIGALVLVVIQGTALIGMLRFKEKTSELTAAEKKIAARITPNTTA